MESNLTMQEDLIQAMVASYNQSDVLSISRQINIESTDFYSELMPIRQLVDKFVTRAFQLDKGYELFNKFNELRRNMISTSSVSDRSAEIFGKLLNHYLNSNRKSVV